MTGMLDAFRTSQKFEHSKNFPGLGARFYRSLALVLARRLRETSKHLARAKAPGKPGSKGG
jgi:hypothetical protein